MFIRVKRIKKQEYAYKVRNRWTRKGTRQVIVGYLGRIYRLQPLEHHQDLTFETFLSEHNYSNKAKIKDFKAYLAKVSSKELIKDLIRYELFKHGFRMSTNGLHLRMNMESETSNILHINLSEIGVADSTKPVVLAMNNDFLCSYTLRKLLKFKSLSDEDECGKELAQAFVSAGIAVVPDTFVHAFNKVFSESGMSYVKSSGNQNET